MFKNILIVCVGNICRSPMGEAIFKHIAQQADIPVSISSAGIAAMEGYQADPVVKQLLTDQGIDCSWHRARQLTKEMLSEADLVLVMEDGHRKEIERIYPSFCGKVHLLGKWCNFEIPDPYRKSKQFFEETYQLISQSINEWQKKLWK